jgi:DnaJ-class molecular chaperone
MRALLAAFLLLGLATASFYDDLGIPDSSDEGTIKKAYRKLAQQHHPDKVADPAQHDAAKAMMTKINWAKEVLQKR